MSTKRFRSRVTTLRCYGNKPGMYLNYELEAMLKVTGMNINLRTVRASEISVLDIAVDRLRKKIGKRVPQHRWSNSYVEAGWVEHRVYPEGRNLQPYLLAVSGRSVLVLSSGLACKELETPVTTIIGFEEVDPELPVMLGPSATLGLIEFCFEQRRGEINHVILNPLLLMSETTSPYPPHRLPELGVDMFSRLAGLPITLLTRPESWIRPYEALPVAGARSIKVVCNVPATSPRRALIVDSITPLANGNGNIECEIEYQVKSEECRSELGERPLRLLLNPWQVLSRVTGTASLLRPALSSDPIAGDRFGLAPLLSTNIPAGELME